MRPKSIILVSAIACITGAIFFFICKYTYDFKVTELKEKAKDAFVKAIDQELKKRNIEGTLSFYFNAKSALSANMPDSIYIEDMFGKYWYRLDSIKNQMNITNDTNLRALHSAVLGKNPLLPDTLKAIWSKQLQEYDIFLESACYISVMDIDGDVKSQSTYQSEWCNPSNLVFTFYLGYACEIKVIGYLKYSVWNIIFREMIFYLLLCVVLGCGLYNFLIFLYRKIYLLRGKEIVEVEIIKEVEVIKEVSVEVPIIKEVQRIDAAPIHSYKLGEHIILYAERNIVALDGVEKRIQPQSSRLLELFLEEGDNSYVLKTSVMMEKLWPDGSGNEFRLQKAVGRLRSCICKMDPSLNIKKNIDGYQLIFLENESFEYCDKKVDEMDDF